jgi:hypothetical protein
MAMLDSMDKIITRYFSTVTNEEFVYKKQTYTPKLLIVSPLLFRGFICPEKCGACCPRFSLDYLPFEDKPKQAQERIVNFNRKNYTVFSDLQVDHNNYHCRNLNMNTGRCKIHTHNPFSCDFELIRPLLSDVNNALMTRMFGKGWNMKKIDNCRGALCKLTPATKESINNVIRKLKRLEKWCNYFGIDNKCESIIKWGKEISPYMLYNTRQPVRSITIY